jgi:5-methylcytosine-specific restriction endonuclease McrA
MPQSFCVTCRRRISKGSRCAQHRVVSPSSKAWHEPGAGRARAAVLDRDRGCRICGDVEDLTIHHVVPARDGGPTTPSNLLVLCRDCHELVEQGEISLGHRGRTDPAEGLRTAYRGSDGSTDIERRPKWAS